MANLHFIGNIFFIASLFKITDYLFNGHDAFADQLPEGIQQGFRSVHIFNKDQLVLQVVFSKVIQGVARQGGTFYFIFIGYQLG